MSTMLQVNGVAHALAAEFDTPLIDCLRDDLGLTGTRIGRGSGHRGAGTVQHASACACATCR